MGELGVEVRDGGGCEGKEGGGIGAGFGEGVEGEGYLGGAAAALVVAWWRRREVWWKLKAARREEERRGEWQQTGGEVGSVKGGDGEEAWAGRSQ